jgi:NAD(P)-dependent dehydrogenase (short-subunit alcohol dehydrogenase family)
VVADIRGEGAARVAEEIQQQGGSATGCAVDVADEAMIVAMTGLAVDRYGGLDVLFNNAAATGSDGTQQDGSVTEQDVDIWDRTMAVNLRGPMLGCKHAIPHMLRRGGGSIINTASPGGLLAEPVHLAYGASKAGLILLTKHVASTHGKLNIRCNALLPGAVVGENTAAAVPAGFLEQRTRHTPAPRLGMPEDIANVVAFLCRDETAYVNGAVIPVDGGYIAHLPYFADHVELLKSVNATT